MAASQSLRLLTLSFSDLLCQSHCRRCSLTSVSSASRQWLFRASHLNESVSLTGSRSVTSPDMTLSRSKWSHYNVHLFGASSNSTFLFRRWNYAPLTQTCTAGVCARSCKSRRAPRPRKLDETLSRHGRSARRVAFLSPRATFSEYCSPLDYLYARFKSQYCSPLDYLYARFKLYQKDEKHIPHFRRTALFTSGGGIPEGKEGEQSSHVRGRKSCKLV